MNFIYIKKETVIPLNEFLLNMFVRYVLIQNLAFHIFKIYVYLHILESDEEDDDDDEMCETNKNLEKKILSRWKCDMS